jgi:hypothetical protein
MSSWSDETLIIESSKIDFYLQCFKHKNLGKYENLDLIEIQENEFRRESSIYYSRIIRYRLLGYLLPNEEHSLSNYFLCTSCFQRIKDIENYKECSICETNFEEKDKPFFLNYTYFTDDTTYKKYKKEYNLGIIEEHIRDQRTSMCAPLKEAIIMESMHPRRIQRILDLTDDLENLDNYI